MAYNPSPYDDDWEDQPAQGPFYRWVLGVAVPVALAAYGAAVLVSGEARFHGSRGSMDLHGVNASAFGGAAIALALILHNHYFWGNVYDQAWFAVLGKIIGLLGIIAGLGVLIVRVGVLGVR